MPEIPEWLQKGYVRDNTGLTWKSHKEKWSNCMKCPLYKKRKKVVLARGDLPCDVLFIGEAPGQSEDVIGNPFVGPAGKLLDDMISDAVKGLVTMDENGEEHSLKYAMTNLISCIPLNDLGEVDQPTKEQITACTPRLEELMKLANPKVIIRVGKIARAWIDADNSEGVTIADIDHPAFLLREHVSQRALAIQRNTVAIRDALEEI